jgi:pimeloyl-ACP methyl ester carboxylesterase
METYNDQLPELSKPEHVIAMSKVGPATVFYREAGDPRHPALLLLPGFPTSSHMFRNLIPLLAERYHVVAPDLPGFGFTVAPDRSEFTYSFDNLAKVIGAFTDAIGLRRFAIYVFDYGAPVGFRLAVSDPDRITGIISQNGNAYEEGLSGGWSPIQRYWQDPTTANRKELRSFLNLEATKWQYIVTDATEVAPESYTLDSALLMAMMRSSSISSSTMPVTSPFIRGSRPTLPSIGRLACSVGARKIRFSCHRVPRRLSGTSPMPRCISSTPGISRWKPTSSKSRKPYENFWGAPWRPESGAPPRLARRLDLTPRRGHCARLAR